MTSLKLDVGELTQKVSEYKDANRLLTNQLNAQVGTRAVEGGGGEIGGEMVGWIPIINSLIPALAATDVSG